MRKTSVAGTFYPNNCDEINKYIDHFNSILKNANIEFDNIITPRAIISPHAGYIYSGFTANYVYSQLDKVKPKNIIVIGPSHRVFVDGASIALFNDYETPCGNLEINTTLSKELHDRFDFLKFQENAHQEHSTETQFPFIQHYFDDIEVIEIVYGQIDYKEISKLIDFLLADKDNFIVISTDLSHFYNQEEANSLDSICLDAIDKMEVELFDQGCEACGIIGVKAIIESAKKQNMKTKVLDYRTSADASGDTSRVVGYVSAIIHDLN